jgi:hypothetical protein
MSPRRTYSSRRQFLKQLSLAGLASSLPAGTLFAFDGGARPASPGLPQAAVKNRAPLARSAFYPLPLGAIRPAGWLQAQLKIQADGLGGHLDETWPDVGPNSGWLGGTGESWERGPYTQWNYALELDAASPSHNISATEAEVGDRPFTAKGAPVKLQVKGRKLPAWQAEDGVAAPVPQGPVASDQPEETITLIPYAAPKLRITAFPRLKKMSS